MRIVIDLDGTICPVKRPDESYASLLPLPGAVDGIRALRAASHYVIISTARNMATCQGNLGAVMKNVGKTTLDWLSEHGIEYDEVHFGKPNGHVYIDDRGLRFSTWSEITEERLRLAAGER